MLEWFEFVTDELQSNRINISRDYPCIEFLKKKCGNVRPFFWFLDPSFGIQVFNEEKKKSTQSRFISLVKQIRTVDQIVSQQSTYKDVVAKKNEKNFVERMFSIAGHVFQSKRRRMGQALFSDLVFLKLNEAFLVKNFL